MAFNPPRLGVAGQTGTYQVIFTNGTAVTLGKVRLSYTVGPGGSRPYFEAWFRSGGWQRISATATGGTALDADRIEAIFRLDEDLNDSLVPEASARTSQAVVFSVRDLSGSETIAALQVSGAGGRLEFDRMVMPLSSLARPADGEGISFTVMLADTESPGGLSVDARAGTLTLTVLGARSIFSISRADAARLQDAMDALTLPAATEAVAVFEEGSDAFVGNLRAIARPVEAIIAAEVRASSKHRRGFADEEQRLLTEIYGSSVDYDSVVITARHFFSPFLPMHSAMTLKNRIIYPRRGWSEDFSQTAGMSLLCHEVCHVWQEQNLKYHWLRALLEHIRFGRRVYEYDIEEHDALTDYRFEQQGAILQAWWGIRNNPFTPPETRKRYESVIYRSIERG